MFGMGDDERTEIERTYTEHEAVVTYSNGDQEPVVFDSTTTRNGAVRLYDYVGVTRRGFKKQVKAIISLSDLRKIETTDRAERTIGGGE